MVRNKVRWGLRFYECLFHSVLRTVLEVASIEAHSQLLRNLHLLWAQTHTVTIRTQCEKCRIRDKTRCLQNTKDAQTSQEVREDLRKKVQLPSWAEQMMNYHRTRRGEKGLWWPDTQMQAQKRDSPTLIIKLQRQAEKHNPAIVPLLQAIAICQGCMVICSPRTTQPQILTQPRNQTKKKHCPFLGNSTCTNTCHKGSMPLPLFSWFWPKYQQRAIKRNRVFLCRVLLGKQQASSLFRVLKNYRYLLAQCWLRFESRLYHLLKVWSWTSYLTLLSL